MTNNEESNRDDGKSLDDFDDFEPDEVETRHPRWKHEERKRAILTERDRELIWGELDLEGQKLRDAQYRIRERVRNGIFDIEGIASHLEVEELEKIVEKLEERTFNDPIQDGRRHETHLAVKSLLNLAVSIQWIHCFNRNTSFFKELEINLSSVVEKVYGPGELSIDWESFGVKESQEDIAKKIVESNATYNELHFYYTQFGYDLLLELMEEKEVDHFLVSNEDGPDFYYSREKLRSEKFEEP